jgi:hypothetical protein
MLGCCSFLYGGKRTGVFADGTPTDMVCRMQGYDHGSVGSIPWSLYCGANLSDQLGCMIDMKYLLVPSMKQKMANALWGEVFVLNTLRVSLVTVAALLLAVVPQLRFCRQSAVTICALSMVKMEAVASNAASPVSLSVVP